MSWVGGIVLYLIVSLAVAIGGLVWHVSRYLAYHRTQGLPGPDVSAEAVRAEVSSLVEIGWLRLLRTRASELRLPPERQGRTVALVHGYWDQAASFWKLRDHLTSLGHPTVGVELGFQLGALERYAARLEAALRRISEGEPEGIDVVAHSMGGIVLRVVLRDHADLRDRVAHAVTLGTPHHGTGAGVRMPLLLPEMRALSEGSALLADLPQLSDLLPPERIVTVGGTFDLVVYPVQNTFDPRATTVALPALGHGGLLTDDRSLRLVADALADQIA
ncbi:MAG: hypothetical protein AAF602_15690 [Myxococcota bacterium]